MGAHWRENRSMISEIRNDSHGTVRGTRRPGPAARARLACLALPCAAAMAAMSPMAAQAQVHISNAPNHVTGNAFGSQESADSGEVTLHLVQPFTTPAGSGNIPLRNVVLHFTSMPLALDQVKLYLYRAIANPTPTTPPELAPTVPDSSRANLPTQEPEAAGRLAEFMTPTNPGGGQRYQFDAPSGTVLAANTTYHLYLWSTAGRVGPEWRTVRISESGGPIGDVSFTGQTYQCSGGWTFLRGLSDDVKNNFDEGWLPWSNQTYVTEIVGEPNHSPTSGATITGSQTIGEMLTADTATIVDANGLSSSPSFTYQWFRTDHNGRNSEPISGATSRTYTPTEDDEGRQLRVQVVYTDDDCYEHTTTDNTDNTFASGLTLDGTAQIGQLLTAITDNITDANGLPSSPSFTYQWTRVDADGVSNPEDIAGATSRTYTPVGDDSGKRVRVTVSFPDSRGNPEALSALSDTIEQPSMFGKASVNGNVLTVTMTKALDEASVPAASAFTVSGGHTVSGVTVSGETVTLTLTSVVGPDETVTVSYAVPGSGSVLRDAAQGGPATAFTNEMVTNETPTVTLVLERASIDEDGGTSTVTASLDKPSPKPTTVTVTVEPVAPAVASDYTLSGSRLTIAPNSQMSTGLVRITARDNDADAPDKTVTVSGTATNSQGVTGPDDVTLTITDDDVLPVVTVVSGGDVTEGEAATFTLTREGPDVEGADVDFSGQLDVFFTVTGGDLVLDGVAPTSATFGRNLTTTTVAVPTTNDLTDEPDATLTLTLTDNDAYHLGEQAAEVVVMDDEDTPEISVADADAEESHGRLEFQVTMDPASWQEVSVGYAITPVSAQAADYTGATSGTVTFQPGGISANITLDLVNDDIEEEEETVEVTLSAPQPSSAATLADPTATGTINANDIPDLPVVTVVSGDDVREDEDATFTLRRSGTDISEELVVSFTVTDDNDDNKVLDGVAPTEVPTEVTFEENSDTATVAVPTTDDNVDEPDGMLTLTLAGSDDYNVGVPAQAEAGVRDNDDTPSISVADASASEGEDDNLVFQVDMDRASWQTVSVDYVITIMTGSAQAVDDAITPVSAQAVADTAPTSGTVTFQPGETSAGITLPLENDDIQEQVTVEVMLSNPQPSSAADLGDATATGTIKDDDLPVVTVVSEDDVTEGEDAMFTLTRMGTRDPLVVTFTVTDNGSVLDGDAPTEATFEANSATATVAVPTMDDNVDEPDTTTLTLTLIDGAAYDLGTPAQAEVGVRDNDGTPELNVEGASASEGDDLVFLVTLNPASSQEVSVDYEITPRTAQAADYTGATSGTVTFQPGETSANITLDLMDDDIQEEEETVEVTISNPESSSAVALGDATTATGTIEDNDLPLVDAWLGRFGRTVAGQVLDAVEARMTAARQTGGEVSIAGRRVGAAWAFDEAASRDSGAELATDLAGLLTISGRELLTGTSFARTEGTAESGFVSLWGRGAVTGFDGQDGDLSVDGEVATGLLGADWARDDWAAGLMVGHSRGEGGYSGQGAGTVSSSLTGLYPWGRRALNDRVTAWGVAGYGQGTLTLEPEGGARIETDMDLAMAAAGLRGVLVEAPAEGGFELAAKTDGLIVRSASEAARGDGGAGMLEAADAEVTRLRLGLEGTRAFRSEGGGTLTPSFGLGARHDGGDAETGFGVEVGAGLAYADPSSGLTGDLQGRGLLGHEASGFREFGLSGSLAFDPSPSSDRGPSLSLRQTVGAAATGGVDALYGRDTMAGLAAGDGTGAADPLGRRSLEVRAGYGLPAFDGRFTGTPELGFRVSESGRDYSLGWRLTPEGHDAGSFAFHLEATRREDANDNAPEHGVGLRAAMRW